jgi:hypothetical protein
MRFFLVAALLAPATALCAERLACEARVPDEDRTQWSWRTKVQGGDYPEQRCWYRGPRMKPRDELYWPPAPSAGQSGGRSVEQPGYPAVPGLQPPGREVMDDESFDGQAVGRARDMATPPSDEAGATFDSRWPR